MAQNLKTISETNFVLGYNDRDKPENLRTKSADGVKVYMADIKNGYVEENKIIKRTGFTHMGAVTTSKPVLGQNRFEISGGGKFILRAKDNSGSTNSVIEVYSGAAWTNLTGGTSQTAGLKHQFVTVNNACYIFDGADVVLKTTDGATTSTVAAIPIGTNAVWFHNYLFVYGVTGNKSTLYFSDVNTPETFDGTNGYININPGDNDDLVGHATLADNLLMFKKNMVWGLTGFGTTDFTLDDLFERSSGNGTMASGSRSATPDAVYYLSFQGDVPHFRKLVKSAYGNIVDGGIISSEITGTMRRLVTTQMSNCAGIYDGRKIRWSVCTSGTTNNEELVYDTITGGWVRNTGINASVYHISTLSGVEQVCFGSATTSGKSHKFDGATSDDGTAIDFSVTTPMYAPIPGHKCRFKYLYMTGDVSSAVDVTVDYSPDGFSFDNLGTLSLSGQGAVFGTAIFDTSKFGATTVARDRLDYAGGQAYYMQYKFSNSELDEELSIREWELFYQPKALRSIN